MSVKCSECFWYWAIPEKNRGWGHTFLKTPLPGNFHFFHLTPANSRQNSSTPGNSKFLLARYLGNFKVKNQDPWKFHITFFLVTLLNSTSFLINPWMEIAHSVLQYNILFRRSQRYLVSGAKYRFFNSNVSEIWLTETASDSLKTGVTKKLIFQEPKDISLSCKKHWKAYLILL